MVDEVLETDPKTGNALIARMAKGVQAIDEVGDLLIIHYVDDDYVLYRLEIPKSEVTSSSTTSSGVASSGVSASNNINVEKLKQLIASRVNDVRDKKSRAKKLAQLLGYTVQ